MGALPSFNDEVVPEEELVGATCTCCGKTVSKPSCSITLYQHCNYGGYGINLAPGSYNMNTLIAKGMKNDDLSSVRIHGSCRAILYQHINFGGASMTKDSDDSCFTNDRMAIPVSQLHQLVVTERPKMPEDEENEDDEVDEVDTNGRRLLGRRAVSWNDQISSAKVQDRQAAAHSCTAVCKAPCAKEKAEKAAAAEKAAKAAEKKRRPPRRRQRKRKRRMPRKRQLRPRLRKTRRRRMPRRRQLRRRPRRLRRRRWMRRRRRRLPRQQRAKPRPQPRQLTRRRKNRPKRRRQLRPQRRL